MKTLKSRLEELEKGAAESGCEKLFQKLFKQRTAHLDQGEWRDLSEKYEVSQAIRKELGIKLMPSNFGAW